MRSSPRGDGSVLPSGVGETDAGLCAISPNDGEAETEQHGVKGLRRSCRGAVGRHTLRAIILCATFMINAMLESDDSDRPPAPGTARLIHSGKSSLWLLERAQDGDREALGLLYERYLPPLRRWARGRLPRWARAAADTDDLVQDTLLNSLRGVEAFDPRHSGAFQAYLRQGILNRLRDEIRKVKRRPQHHEALDEAIDPGPSPVDEAVGRETMARYEAALEKIKPEDREAILGRVELGFSYEELAADLGKPSSDAARMAVSRALLRLAREMSRGGS
jgi:RNA polymerase sigma factor (sigma-70 family)